MNRDRRSRSYRIRQKRKRELMIKTGALITVTVLIFAGSVGIWKNQHQTEGDTKKQAGLQKREVVAEPTEEITEEIKEVFQYPEKSEKYVEIVSENVKSPYVALLDVEKNKIIAGRNSDTKIYPASMTKVMSLIVAVEHIQDLNQTFQMTAELVDPLVYAGASRAGFEAGDTVTAKDMLYGLILPSGADAAVGLATMVAGSESAFADMMNEKCEELGLKNTHFMNASGLHDENQYTTPVEMAMILKYAMENEICAEVLSTYQYTTAALASNPEGILLTSTMFSRMYGTEVEGVVIQAGKTGYTDEARNCLVSYAEKNGHHYVALTAGAENRWYVIYDDFEIYGQYLPEEVLAEENVTSESGYGVD